MSKPTAESRQAHLHTLLSGASPEVQVTEEESPGIDELVAIGPLLEFDLQIRDIHAVGLEADVKLVQVEVSVALHVVEPRTTVEPADKQALNRRLKTLADIRHGNAKRRPRPVEHLNALDRPLVNDHLCKRPRTAEHEAT